jgi:hypothetical protein
MTPVRPFACWLVVRIQSASIGAANCMSGGDLPLTCP